MDRRTYERMMREIRAIHHALTGEELRVESTPRADGEERASAPSEEELVQRFAELASEARAIPSVAFELWALGLDEESGRAVDAGPAAQPLAERADAED